MKVPREHGKPNHHGAESEPSERGEEHSAEQNPGPRRFPRRSPSIRESGPFPPQHVDWSGRLQGRDSPLSIYSQVIISLPSVLALCFYLSFL